MIARKLIFAGGTNSGAGFLADVSGGSGGFPGSGGYATTTPSMIGSVYQPMFFTAGGGGGSVNIATGAAGGNGSYGAGGGGGGAGTTGGVGGRGGDGLIIVTAF